MRAFTVVPSFACRPFRLHPCPVPTVCAERNDQDAESGGSLRKRENRRCCCPHGQPKAAIDEALPPVVVKIDISTPRYLARR